MKSKKDKLLERFLSLGWRQDTQAANVFDFLSNAADNIPNGSVLLDLGAGQCRYAFFFEHCHYIGVDFALGDAKWDYSKLDIVGDICSPSFFKDNSVDFILNTVTLEHLNEPALFLREVGRILKPGGVFYLYAPMTASEHQIPYDFFRYTSYGIKHLCDQAGLEVISCTASNGPLYTASRWLYLFLGALVPQNLPTKILRKGLRGIFKYLINPLCDKLDKLPTEMSMPMLWLVSAQKAGKVTDNAISELKKEQIIESIIKCPQCSATLNASGNGYACTTCRLSFKGKNSQINFLEPTPLK